MFIAFSSFTCPEDGKGSLKKFVENHSYGKGEKNSDSSWRDMVKESFDVVNWFLGKKNSNVRREDGNENMPVCDHVECGQMCLRYMGIVCVAHLIWDVLLAQTCGIEVVVYFVGFYVLPTPAVVKGVHDECVCVSLMCLCICMSVCIFYVMTVLST